MGGNKIVFGFDQAVELLGKFGLDGTSQGGEAEAPPGTVVVGGVAGGRAAAAAPVVGADGECTVPGREDIVLVTCLGRVE